MRGGKVLFVWIASTVYSGCQLEPSSVAQHSSSSLFTEVERTVFQPGGSTTGRTTADGRPMGP